MRSRRRPGAVRPQLHQPAAKHDAGVGRLGERSPKLAGHATNLSARRNGCAVNCRWPRHAALLVQGQVRQPEVRMQESRPAVQLSLPQGERRLHQP